MDRATELLRRACSGTGLQDFGEDSFREGLKQLLRSVDGEARMTADGAASFDGQLVHFLSQRLQVEDWYRRHPEIEQQQIIRPLIGLGLPRTGSTALGHLLGEDPAIRSLRGWEASSPCPPPETATEHTDPRIEETRRALEFMEQQSPRMRAMLPSSPTAPTECQTLQGMDFKSQMFQSQVHIPSYVQWLNHEADLVPTYRFVKRVLKLLQWRCPPTRWRVKNPSHSMFIGALNQVFPDAVFWMTHRDVAAVIPSCADLYAEMARPYSNHVDRLYIGKLNAETWELGMRRLIAFRDAGNEHRFVDVHFAAFQQQPIPIIERIYGFLGETLTSQTRLRMQRWLTSNSNSREHRQGEHRYSPEEFGLSIVALRERFRFYTDRFDVLTA